MKEKIIVFGGKGSALVVAEQIFDAQKKGGDFEFLGFAFDDPSFGSEINGFPVLGKTKEIFRQFRSDENVKFLFQLFRPDLMQERIELLQSYQIPANRFAKFIHPSAVVSRSAEVDYGSSILANSVINANARIGKHCTIHSNSLVGHDTTLGNYNFVAAHNVIGSNSQIGNANFFGINSSINNYIKIGDNCFIGMASNVTKGIPSSMKVYGNPAKEFINKVKPL